MKHANRENLETWGIAGIAALGGVTDYYVRPAIGKIPPAVTAIGALAGGAAIHNRYRPNDRAELPLAPVAMAAALAVGTTALHLMKR